MKVPVEIDFRRASFTLCQFEVKGNMKLCHFENWVGIAEEVDFGAFAGSPCDPTTPSQIMARASAARGNWDWDKEAIFSRSCLLVTLSAPSVDSSFILLTSRETCNESISGKLR